MLASLGASICATLINPYGPGLWAYLPHLFFGPINRFIIELQPIAADSFLDPSVVLSTLLPVFCFGGIAYRAVKLRIADSTQLRSPVRLSSALIALLALFACLSCRRLIVAASVMILIESANFLGDFGRGKGLAEILAEVDFPDSPRTCRSLSLRLWLS